MLPCYVALTPWFRNARLLFPTTWLHLIWHFEITLPIGKKCQVVEVLQELLTSFGTIAYTNICSQIEEECPITTPLRFFSRFPPQLPVAPFCRSVRVGHPSTKQSCQGSNADTIGATSPSYNFRTLRTFVTPSKHSSISSKPYQTSFVNSDVIRIHDLLHQQCCRC